MKQVLFVWLILFNFVSASYATAQELLSAPQALQKAELGEIVILDIRSREEWKETGIAAVAIPVSMHEGDFLQKFEQIKADNQGKEIAIICATGGRTKWLQAELKKRKLGTVIDISEGMMGNGKAAGWIKRGMPIKKFK